jgi:phosphoribosyl 1,2-cyclic phosphodiesterase
MKLNIINSNSSGNCYILQNAKEALIIECGVKFDRIKKALKYNISKVAGCLVSHAHLDHCKGAAGLMQAGVRIYATHGTHKQMNIEAFNHRKKVIDENIQFQVGGFKVVAFGVKHDAAQPVGFLIHHEECGTVLFLTDTVYSPYTFKGLNNLIIEANYCEEVLEEKLNNGTEKFLRDRVIESHLSIQNCKELLKANDLSKVNNIVLIHLSNNHSDAVRFQREVQELTGKNVIVADEGMEIEFGKTAF